MDAKHEVVLAYQVTTANAADCKSLPDLVEQGQANLPAGRIETLAYDKAADDNDSHRMLHAAKIRPVIQNRHLWKDQTEQMLPGHDGNSNIVYDEAGTLYCYDRTSQPIVRHQMAYIGYEPERETIKYRCPARHEGWTCPHDAVCNAGKSYGKTVRVNRTIDLRRFPPIPRATKKFERLYNGRTSVERVNARLKIFWGVDDGNIRGARRFHAMVGTVHDRACGFCHAAGCRPAAGRHLGQTPPGTDPESAGTATRSLRLPDASSQRLRRWPCADSSLPRLSGAFLAPSCHYPLSRRFAVPADDPKPLPAFHNANGSRGKRKRAHVGLT